MEELGITAREDTLKVHPQQIRTYSKYYKLKIFVPLSNLQEIQYIFVRQGTLILLCLI